MKKLAKTAPKPLPAVREPTEDELRAIEKHVESEKEFADEMDADDTAVELASTAVDLAHIGLNQIAYVRRATIDDVQVWSIHSAMGHPLGAAPTLEQAWGAVKQNDLQPVFVH